MKKISKIRLKIIKKYHKAIRISLERFLYPVLYKHPETWYLHMKFLYNYAFPLFIQTMLILGMYLVKYKQDLKEKRKVRKHKMTSGEKIYRECLKELIEIRKAKNMDIKLEDYKHYIETAILSNKYLAYDYQKGNIVIPYYMPVFYYTINIFYIWKKIAGMLIYYANIIPNNPYFPFYVRLRPVYFYQYRFPMVTLEKRKRILDDLLNEFTNMVLKKLKPLIIGENDKNYEKVEKFINKFFK